MNYFELIGFNGNENLKLLMGGAGSERLTYTEKKILFKKHVEIINLELSYQCNRKCDYCPVSFSDRHGAQKYLDTSVLEKACQELAQIRYDNKISLNLYNEPLMDPTLESKIHTVRQYLPASHIGFNSNGDYLKLSRLITLSASGLDQICVTLHPLPNVTQTPETILRRVTKLLNKLEYTAFDDKMSLSYIENHELIDFRQLGVRVIIQWPDWRKHGTNRGGTLEDHSSSNYKRIMPCARPFREFTIFYDGNVQPCCESFHDSDTNLEQVGNIATTSIFDLYTSKKLNLMRRSLYDFSPKQGICASCTVADFSSIEDDPMRKALVKTVIKEAKKEKIDCYVNY
ncbi:radical SAM/SPASM domain-containing protein [Pseudoalteromonas luteoviolacea]|uniref:Uncharacterized protein n=2 Tax=Pseudoalteromonas luteoviolacea TaxID=43657 RepID=A0A0F6A447_9GAMM|nr:radical SAM/SPASM domain-containing protein [Pseudoalteromonas luteoviolacea]AOT11077.1 hypothetical protein S4054249_24905 [Pseudoalteromonas luteoviolacea]AOT15759.1 hypothetical protein S40542_23605 [Pseudoalteromonas luteoviolacea]AOT20898.1 hypothetical protein S4054_24825 [Pseudoalteromonas luteoviolacea]KKE80987.1 hypothetical protein N479_24065 [Pseudoalteromonas luteoviolacea S4054]KZN74552.1 hypothetical protein N481_09010 [Pseudoalteromonas luteoviolacea S4047-1]